MKGECPYGKGTRSDFCKLRWIQIDGFAKTILAGMTNILSTTDILQIGKRGISLITINVIDLLTLRAGTDKSFNDESMNGALNVLTVYMKCDMGIPAGIHRSLENPPNPGAIGQSNTAYPTQDRDLIASFGIQKGTPFLIFVMDACFRRESFWKGGFNKMGDSVAFTVAINPEADAHMPLPVRETFQCVSYGEALSCCSASHPTQAVDFIKTLIAGDGSPFFGGFIRGRIILHRKLTPFDVMRQDRWSDPASYFTSINDSGQASCS